MSKRDMKAVINHVRRQTDAILAKRELKGQRIAPDEAAGRLGTCWVHGAERASANRIVVELHGGGFALGDARRGDALREWVCDSFGVVAVGVGYRLAPEHPAPAALDDVISALRYLSRRFKDERGGLPELYLLGFSAGANLALSAAEQLQGDTSVKIGGLILHYPMVDASEDPSGKEGDAGLSATLVDAFTSWYTTEIPVDDVRVSPALASDELVRGLPRTALYPVVGDPLYDQAVRLHERMCALGCDASCHSVKGMYHGYIEDAEDLDLYRATTMPQTIAARPADFAEVASQQLQASLEEFLGPQSCNIAFADYAKEGTL